MNKTKQKLTFALATRWRRRHGRPYGQMGSGLLAGAVGSYMRNWLSQHGELPSGIHTVALRKGKHNGIAVASTGRVKVDFTALQLADHDLPSVSPELAK